MGIEQCKQRAMNVEHCPMSNGPRVVNSGPRRIHNGQRALSIARLRSGQCEVGPCGVTVEG
eukprot:11177261-Lingulodinium_polyedra.AAC.1